MQESAETSDQGAIMICRHLRNALISLALTMVFVGGGAAAAERVALVIGNSAYAHAPRLKNPGNDADAVAAALDRLGFEVTLLRDLDFARFQAALGAFQASARGADVALVYYAGHGIGVDGQSWLLPIDARLTSADRVEFETVPLDLVLASVSVARGLRIIILDACRDNPFSRNMARGDRSVSRGLERIEPGGDTLLWYAARDGSTAADGSGRHSPFTSALLKHIERPGLELDRVFREITATVRRVTGGEQVPWQYGTARPRGCVSGWARP